MPVTAIRRVHNQSPWSARFRNLENGHTHVVAPQSPEQDYYEWLPWAPSEGDYPHHHIALQLVDAAGAVRRSANFFQCGYAGLDRVRFTLVDAWNFAGQCVPGEAAVGGERLLTIRPDGSFDFASTAAPPAGDPFTLLRKLTNRSPYPARLVNVEWQEPPGGGVRVDPGTASAISMYVPWAASASDFAHHRLELVVGTQRTCIWQALRQGADRVRATTNGAWQDPGVELLGGAATGGERELVVAPDGTPYLTSWVDPGHGTPPPPPRQGVGRILFAPPAGPGAFEYFEGVAQDAGGGPLPADAVVDRIRNTYAGALGLELRLTDPEDGNLLVADELVLQSETVRAPFAGDPARWSWHARRHVPDVSKPMQPFTVELAWVRPTAVRHGGAGRRHAQLAG